MNKTGDTERVAGPHAEPSNPSEAFQWAHEALGVPVGSAKEQIRSAFLKQLKDEEYSPSVELVTAFSFVAGAGPHTWAEHQLDQAQVEQRLRESINRFAERFFNLAPPERVEEWTRLRAAAARFPVLRRRLDRLNAGLSFPAASAPAWKGARTAELADLWRNVFVATDPEAARLRQAAGDSIRQHRQEWLAAVKELRASDPDWERLDPSLFVWVARGGSDTLPEKRRSRRRTSVVSVAAPPPQENSKISPWIAGIIVAGIIAAARVGGLLNKSDVSPPPSRYNTPSIGLPSSDAYQEYLRRNNLPNQDSRSIPLPGEVADRLKNTDDSQLTPAERATKQIFDLGRKNQPNSPHTRPVPNGIPSPPKMPSRQTGPPFSPSFGPPVPRSNPQTPHSSPSLPRGGSFPTPGPSPRIP